MSWKEDYRSKLRTKEEAIKAIMPHDNVYVGGNAAAPLCMMKALAERAKELKNVTLVHVLLLGEDPFKCEECEGVFHHNSLFVGESDRDSVNSGKSSYVPIHLHQIPKAIKSGVVKVDVAIVQCSPPDEHGFMSLGVEVLANKAAIEVAKTVIIQVNKQMPRVLGDTFIHVSKATYIVETDEPLIEISPPTPSEVERRIGSYVAELIPDGATLQLGIGGIPNSILNYLKGKKDLGIHTEMISDGIIKALEDGIITCSKKTLHPGKIVGTFILGSKKLYELSNDNPIIELHPVDYTNDPSVIAKNEKMVSINSALQIDLTGQVCSDSIGTYIYSGFGGQVDFIRGAAASSGGKPIIALPSTAKDGSVSRIVSKLSEGAGVVTTRADVHYVVTEYGIAELWGKNLQQRAKALIKIAHPNFREQLEKEAKERNLI